ncbi:S1 family peptidase [Psychromonas sp. PT13]|uniref:S1 family peptidase n=1 Tax=Psychromonas sp. PT13 TaxID=3439547 RepID=UPI003EBB5BEF
MSLMLLCSIQAFAATTSTRIVGGDDAEDDYPWMVALYYSGNFTCGGVLISSKWLATAAHCVYDTDDVDGNAIAYDASNFSVVIGESTHYSTTSAATSAGVSVYTINSVVINPNYVTSDDDDSTTDYDYDISLLELDSSYYEPGPAIATASRFSDIEEGDYLTVIGYGVMDSSEDASAEEAIPTTLQEAELPFVPTDECYWNDYGLMSDNMFCAGYDSDDVNIDSCSGDSGGPVFKTIDGELTLVGLVSWGTTTCSEIPGVYTNISNLRSWILENIDGFQVVEEGTASYNSDSDTFTSGLISVYHYGSNDDTDDTLTIGELSFDDDSYADTFSLSDGCSENELASSDSSCNIDFDLLDALDEDTEFDATLSVTPSASAAVQTYNLDFEANLTNDEDSTYTSSDSDDSSSSSSGGSLSFSFLLMLVLLSYWRYKSKLHYPMNKTIVR